MFFRHFFAISAFFISCCYSKDQLRCVTCKDCLRTEMKLEDCAANGTQVCVKMVSEGGFVDKKCETYNTEICKPGGDAGRWWAKFSSDVRKKFDDLEKDVGYYTYCCNNKDGCNEGVIRLADVFLLTISTIFVNIFRF